MEAAPGSGLFIHNLEGNIYANLGLVMQQQSDGFI